MVKNVEPKPPPLEHDEDVWVWELLTNLFISVVTVAIVFGGVVPYAFQYREILRTQNAKGFSAYVCLFLLVANILRVLFWFGKSFEVQLLIQSLVMIVCMLFMVEISVRANKKIILPGHHSKGPSIWEGHIIDRFWQWSDFSSYLVIIIWFSAFMFTLTFALLDKTAYVETIGFLALFTEAILGTPQFYNNLQRKSTYGMSVKMVLMWTVGDISKTVYFVAKNTPPQFYICGLLQICVDLAILSQVVYYSHASRKIGDIVARTIST